MWKNNSKSSSLSISNCQADAITHFPAPSSSRGITLSSRAKCQFYGDVVADLRWSWMQLQVLFLYKKDAFVSKSKHRHRTAISAEFCPLILYYREQNIWSAEGMKAGWGRKRQVMSGSLGDLRRHVPGAKPMQVRGSLFIYFSASWPKPCVNTLRHSTVLGKITVLPVTAGCPLWKSEAVEAKAQMGAQGTGLQVTCFFHFKKWSHPKIQNCQCLSDFMTLQHHT